MNPLAKASVIKPQVSFRLILASLYVKQGAFVSNLKASMGFPPTIYS